MSEEKDVQQGQEDSESRARRMGWVPKEEFRGDPDNWRDADEFLRRGEEMLGIANERNRKLDDRIQQLEQTIKQFTEYHKKVEKRTHEKLKKEYETELERIRQEMRDAVKDGDTQKFEDLEKRRAELKAPEEEVPQTPDAPQAFLEWRKSNPWYTAPGFESPEGDPKLSRYADQIAKFLVDDPDFRFAADSIEFYEAVKQEVQNRFPDRFEGGQSRRQTVEGGSGDRTARKRTTKGKTKADLPAEDRKEMERYIAEGLLTEEEYLKEYEWDE